jgi:YHS domain-containing protein
MKVDRSEAVTTTFDGETVSFCSQHCLHAFEADPRRYRQR